MDKTHESLSLALNALEQHYLEDVHSLQGKAITAIREALAQPEQEHVIDCPRCGHCCPQPEQEFTTHKEGEDGWSDWVCPDPKSYLMKCCDCGLVHEAQFKVVRYKSEDECEECDTVDDPNVQAVFRMRRSEQWTPKDTAYRPGGLAQPEQELLAWKNAALRVGEDLSSIGPNGYYNMTAQQWLDWAMAQQPRGNNSLAQPEQEPVAWITKNGKGWLRWHSPEDSEKNKDSIPLYTAPPKREWQGLTDEEMHECWDSPLTPLGMKHARMIEAKLKEKNT